MEEEEQNDLIVEGVFDGVTLSDKDDPDFDPLDLGAEFLTLLQLNYLGVQLTKTIFYEL